MPVAIQPASILNPANCSLVHDLAQFAFFVLVGNLVETDRLDAPGHTFATESQIAAFAHLFGRFASRLQIVARVESTGILE